MSIPALRQPKSLKPTCESVEKYVILTLKNGAKLVVSSDAFNGIVTVGDGFKCVLCCAEIPLESKSKEIHKELQSHKRILERYPHKEDFGANLIRQLNKDICYCTICNATMPAHMLMYHIAAYSHIDELQKALTRAESYRPIDVNNNK